MAEEPGGALRLPSAIGCSLLLAAPLLFFVAEPLVASRNHVSIRLREPPQQRGRHRPTRPANRSRGKRPGSGERGAAHGARGAGTPGGAASAAQGPAPAKPRARARRPPKPAQILRPPKQAPAPAPRRPAARAGPHEVILCTWVFGQEEYLSARFPLFLRSAAGCGVDVALLGDAPPPGMQLPPNVRSVPIAWQELVSRVERWFADGWPMPNLRKASFCKLNDLKPFIALLLPEVVRGYIWWGWCDNDIWFGDIGGAMGPHVHNAKIDFITPNFWRNLDTALSWGPMSFVRNTEVMNTLVWWREYRDEVWHVLHKPGCHRFDEWGDTTHGDGLGYEFSFSGLLAKTVSKGYIHLLSHQLPVVEWDGYCEYEGHTLPEVQRNQCGFCSMTFSPTGVTQLRGLDGSERLICHFQYTKYRPWFHDLNEGWVTFLVGQPSISVTFFNGFKAGCAAGQRVSCCPGCKSACYGDQCCRGTSGSVTCPSSPVSRAPGCSLPKQHRCTDVY